MVRQLCFSGALRGLKQGPSLGLALPYLEHLSAIQRAGMWPVAASLNPGKRELVILL